MTGVYNLILKVSFDGGDFPNETQMEFTVNIRLKEPCVADLSLNAKYGSEIKFNETEIPPTLTLDATYLAEPEWYELKVDTECDPSYLTLLDYTSLYPGTATDFVFYSKEKQAILINTRKVTTRRYCPIFASSDCYPYLKPEY